MIAHIRSSDHCSQPLVEHSNNVGELCCVAACTLRLSHTAQLIGLLHDMGKATAAFKAYLHEVQADPSAVSPHNHAPTGAVFAYRRWFCKEGASSQVRLTAQIISLCILGHHAGLTNCLTSNGTSDYLDAVNRDVSALHYDEAVSWFCTNVITESKLDALFSDACAEITDLIQYIQKTTKGRARHFHVGMLTRLLLSILVDADRYDSACFEYDTPIETVSSSPDWAVLSQTFENFRAANFRTDSIINSIRADISEQCFDKADAPPGIYTLSVPTGTGKTYASLRYALHHASMYNKKRIFYIIPFNTILDQNAGDIRDALSDYPSILEHHCNITFSNEEEMDAYRRLTERWDSDIILTSLVQFLNACFSSSNTDARRLHALTDAVLIFDEIQSLPRHCKVLFEWAITFLSLCCGCTILLCTATQPQLSLSFPPIELVRPGKVQLNTKRVHYVPQLDIPLKNHDAASKIQQMLTSQSVLAIVNTKAAAQDIYAKTVSLLSDAGMHPITPDPFCSTEQIREQARQSASQEVLCVHMSTLLCPAHRKRLIEWSKIWLHEGARVFCISTALIEAGINVSFPVVIRSLAGLPSIVQAAGRSNRSMEFDIGLVYIWHLVEENLRRLPDIEQGGLITRAILAEADADELDAPAQIARYFAREQDYTVSRQNYPIRDGLTLSDLLSSNDESARAARSFKENTKLLLRQSFRMAYSAFQVIPENTVSVLVPFGQGERLIEQLHSTVSMKEKQLLLREAQAYSVSLYQSTFRRLADDGAVRAIDNGDLFVLDAQYYDINAGVLLTPRELDFMLF